MSESQVEIEAVCEIHQGSGRVVIRDEADRVVLDTHADHCGMLTLENPSVTQLFDALGKWLG